MDSFLWQLFNRTSESQSIFGLLHLLLAGLTLLVMVYQLRRGARRSLERFQQFLLGGVLLLVVHFAIRTVYFATGFFLRRPLEWANFERGSHGLIAFGSLLIVAGFVLPCVKDPARCLRWVVRGGIGVGLLVLADILHVGFTPSVESGYHSVPMTGTDVATVVITGFGLMMLLRRVPSGTRSPVVGMALLWAASLLHLASPWLNPPSSIVVWNAEEHVLSAALFAFAWFVGEREQNLLDRVFVRLNLTFIVLASLVLLATAGMEKLQYFRLAQERSMDLAEFLRGHIIFYNSKGDSLEDIFGHSEVMRRVVVEFGKLPELREIHVHLDGRQANFRYTSGYEVIHEIVAGSDHGAELTTSPDEGNRFQMVRLSLDEAPDSPQRIEFFGTMDFVDRYIGNYIIVIYLLFTGMVGLSMLVIGFVVRNADHRLQHQYAEIQSSQRQLAQAAKLASIGELAGGVAHEINNPITAILSTASHLEARRKAALPERDRKSLGLIAREAERVSGIVRNLLIFSRQSRLELGPVDVNEQIRMATSLLDYRLRESPVHFRQDLSKELPLVLADANRLTEVFVNLLTNALDAMPKEGGLTVRTSRNPNGANGIRIEVTDTGSGIPPEDLPRIFDPFFTTKEPGKGTGLGLSISHGIIKDHKGEIWAESTPGTGTTFFVTLPQEARQNDE